MNLFISEIVTPPDHLPITVADDDQALAEAVTDEIERGVLWRAIVRQERKIIIDGPLPPRILLEPVAAIVSLTRWTPSDPAEVVAAASYNFVSRDPAGTIIEPVSSWPAPERSIGSFAVNYMTGWEVSDTENHVPPSVRLLCERALEYRKGPVGLAAIKAGSTVDMPRHDSYQTDRLPSELVSIGRAYQYRAGIFVGRP